MLPLWDSKASKFSLSLVYFITLCLSFTQSKTNVKKDPTLPEASLIYGQRIGVPITSLSLPYYNAIPMAPPDCSGISMFAMFAEISSGCQAYSVCHGGRKSTFFCPEGTLFSQELMTCDYAYRVNCFASPDGGYNGGGPFFVGAPHQPPTQSPPPTFFHQPPQAPPPAPAQPSQPPQGFYPGFQPYPQPWPQPQPQPQPPTNERELPESEDVEPRTVPSAFAPHNPPTSTQGPSSASPPYFFNDWNSEEPEWTFAWMKKLESGNRGPQSDELFPPTRQNFDFALINKKLGSSIIKPEKETPNSPNPWLFPIELYQKAKK